MIRFVNSSAHFQSMTFLPQHCSVASSEQNSVCHFSDIHIALLLIRSPFICDNSIFTVSDLTVSFDQTQNMATSLFSSETHSGTISIRRSKFSDVVVTDHQPFAASNSLSAVTVDFCSFTNISHIPVPFNAHHSSPANTTISHSNFDECHNPFTGGIVRDINSGASLFAFNSSFTRAFTTYHDNTSMTRINFTDTGTHSFLRCSWTRCWSDVTGGAIADLGGAHLSVDWCVFDGCYVKTSRTDHPYGRAGAIIHYGHNQAGLFLNNSFFTRCSANWTGVYDSYNASKLTVLFSNATHNAQIDWTSKSNGYVGCFHFVQCPEGAVVEHLRFQHNWADSTCSGIDNDKILGDIHYSQIFFHNNSASMSGAILYSYTAGSPDVTWFSCIFFNNVARRKGIDTKTGESVAMGNDIWFHHDTADWRRIVALERSFINCFSTSAHPRVVLNNQTKFTHCVTQFDNGTLFDTHVPDPKVVISESGTNSAICGTNYASACRTLGFAGKNRVPMYGGEILVENGDYEETESFVINFQQTIMTSYGDHRPTLRVKTADVFITVQKGNLTFRYFTVRTSPFASLIRQDGTGTMTVKECRFIADLENSAAIAFDIIDLNHGNIHLLDSSFAGYNLGTGALLNTEDFESLTVVNTTFTDILGANATILIVGDAADGADLVVKDCVFEGRDGDEETPAALIIRNVSNAEILNCSFSNLRNQFAPATVAVFESNTHDVFDGLVFERCLGKEASDILIDEESAQHMGTIENCQSTSRKPNGVMAGQEMTQIQRPTHTFVVDVTNGANKPFCWKEGESCQSISYLLSRFGEDLTGVVSALAGTSTETGITVEGTQNFKMTGQNTVLKRADESVPLVDVESGTLSLTSFVLTLGASAGSSSLITNKGNLELKSVTLQKGTTSTFHNPLVQSLTGSISLSSVTIPSELTFSACSLLSLHSSSLSISGTTFNQIKSTSAGAVISGSLEADKTLSITSSTFKACSSDSDGGVISLTVAPNTPSTSLVIQSSFESCSCGAGKKGAWIHLSGSNLDALIQKTSWTGTYETLKLGQDDLAMWGEDSAMTGTPYASLTLLMYLLPYSGDVIFAGSEGRDFDACGMETFPCKTITIGQTHLEGSKVSLIVLKQANMECEIKTSKFGEMEMKGQQGAQTKVVVSGASFFSSTAASNTATILKITDLTFDLSAAASKMFFVSEDQDLTITRSSFILLPTLTAPFVNSINGKLVMSEVSASKTTLSSSPLILSTSSVELFACVFSEIKRTSGLGAILSIELSDSVSAKMINTKFTNCMSEGTLCSVLLTGTNEATFKKESWTGTFDHPLPRSTVLQQTPNWPHDPIYNPYSLLYSWYRPSNGIVFSSSATEEDIDHPFCGHTFLPCRSVDKALADKADVVVVRKKSVLNKEWVMEKAQIEIKAEETTTEEGDKPSVHIELGESASIVIKQQNTNSAKRVLLTALTFSVAQSRSDNTKPFLSLQTGEVHLSKVEIREADVKFSLINANGANVSISDSAFENITSTVSPIVIEKTILSISNTTFSDTSTDALITSLDSTVTSTDTTFAGSTGHFEGRKSDSENVFRPQEYFCRWSSGFIFLDSTPANFTRCSFTGLEQGALKVIDKQCTLAGCSFANNGKGPSLFPSSRHNLDCQGSGSVTIESLSGGDGVGSSSLWFGIDSTCTMSAPTLKQKDWLHNTTLDRSKSFVEHDGKYQEMNVTLVGTDIVPCGLSWRIYEWDERREALTTFFENMPLNSSNVTGWNETTINLTLTYYGIFNTISISNRYAWLAGIRTGNNTMTDLFQFRPSNSKITQAQNAKAANVAVPVIVGVSVGVTAALVVLALLIRRHVLMKRTKYAAMKNDLKADLLEVTEANMQEGGFSGE
ncbi:hypothetical protein BLNAU_14046 [Blattamonas nauphoetae]|uniref:Uncharacterized protein n=1 Tax=Blattamonas nauphoetae TaxID=2049346 RepID=A0ABQ9XET1_9EUKA|nr:hypothetical protein BLNAU_14046 [Blattamonas nauphoetae]